MKIRFTIFFSVAVILHLFSSCFPLTTSTSSNTNTKTQQSSSIYNPFIYRIHPEYFVYHAESPGSRLYMKIYLEELMFAPIGSNKGSQAKLKLEYKVFPINDLSNYIDSSSTTYDIKKRKDQNNIITYINLKENNLNKYYLNIITSDLLRQTTVEEFILVDKASVGNNQNFFIEQKSNNLPYFKDYFRNDQVFSIRYKKPVDSIYVRYYSQPIPFPYPPYSSMTRPAISVVTDSIWSYSGQAEFQFREQKKGFYFIQIDTNSVYGLGLINAGNDFPYLKSSESLVHPLEYLTSVAEYNEILKSSNKKLAVDKFWLNTTKDMNRSRELIRIYYNRVFYANNYFTSFTEGWRTDRGMIYLIFGPPKSVKKSPEKETWVYSDKSNSKYLEFRFNKIANPYSDNDFVLERSIDFKQFWTKSVNSWREGKVYSVFN